METIYARGAPPEKTLQGFLKHHTLKHMSTDQAAIFEPLGARKVGENWLLESRLCEIIDVFTVF